MEKIYVHKLNTAISFASRITPLYVNLKLLRKEMCIYICNKQLKTYKNEITRGSRRFSKIIVVPCLSVFARLIPNNVANSFKHSLVAKAPFLFFFLFSLFFFPHQANLVLAPTSPRLGFTRSCNNFIHSMYIKKLYDISLIR